nr:nucleotide disphospho-sugar-binding domain-containing protein [Methylosinus sp. H3A]
MPENVILAKRAPQLALLRRSALAIVHGGAATIKECAYFGVPMIVFPIGFDHPGNTARVVYHGLGVRGDFRTVTTREMSALLQCVEKDSYIRIQTRLMGEALRAEDENVSVDFVESLLAAEGPPMEPAAGCEDESAIALAFR